MGRNLPVLLFSSSDFRFWGGFERFQDIQSASELAHFVPGSPGQVKQHRFSVASLMFSSRAWKTTDCASRLLLKPELSSLSSIVGSDGYARATYSAYLYQQLHFSKGAKAVTAQAGARDQRRVWRFQGRIWRLQRLSAKSLKPLADVWLRIGGRQAHSPPSSSMDPQARLDKASAEKKSRALARMAAESGAKQLAKASYEPGIVQLVL